jgi:hypothetical protein
MAEMPKIIARRLANAKAGDHPDSNLLGGFVESSLGQRERVQVLEHLSQCASCREIVSLPATQPSFADAVLVAPLNPGWLSWPVLRWAAAAVCLVIVGTVVTLDRKHEGRQIASTMSEDKTVSSQTPEETKTADAVNQAAKAKAASGADGTTAASSPVEMADARTGSPFVDVPARAKDATPQAQTSEIEKGMDRNISPPAGVADTAITPLISTNLTPRWTLSSDGTLQRSRDAGRTWQTIVVANNTVFRALAANGLDIWVGGTAGALFHSSNAGQRWTQVRPVANGELLHDDIIGVEFTDTQHGKLTSTAQEIWITADAGQTWQKQ